MKPLLFIALILLFIGSCGMRYTKSIELEQNCTGFLKQAADANTVETAKAQLTTAIRYLEYHGLTSGYTSIIYKTPDEDIGFWYGNLKSAQSELAKVDSSTSSLERTNMLMKLRETLIDGGKDGDKLTVPEGLEVYPNNTVWAFIDIMGIIAAIILYCMIKT